MTSDLVDDTTHRDPLRALGAGVLVLLAVLAVR